MRRTFALASILALLFLAPSASALLLPAQPQLFATATPLVPTFFAESPLFAADTMRVEAAGTAFVELKNTATGQIVASGTVTGAQVFTFAPVNGNHRLTVVLQSGVLGEASVADESL